MRDASRPPRALALVGMPGSGKTSCATYLQAQGYVQFRFGKIVVDEVIRRGLAVNPQNERTVREELRRLDGMDAIAQRALSHLQQALAEHSVLVIDGLYSWSEYRLLHAELGVPMVVVAVVAPRHLRYERLGNRPERPLTPAEAEARDWQEIEYLEKGGPIAIADYTLVNDGTEADLLTKLDLLITHLQFTP